MLKIKEIMIKETLKKGIEEIIPEVSEDKISEIVEFVFKELNRRLKEQHEFMMKIVEYLIEKLKKYEGDDEDEF